MFVLYGFMINVSVQEFRDKAVLPNIAQMGHKIFNCRKGAA
jgi:hypothetical protein